MKWWWSKWPKRRRCYPPNARTAKDGQRLEMSKKNNEHVSHLVMILLTYQAFQPDTLFLSDFILSKSFSERHHSHRSSRVFQLLTWIPFLEDMLSPDMRKFFCFFKCFFPTLEWILALPWTNVNNIDGDMPRNHAVLRCSASNQGLSRLYGAPCPVKPWCPTLHLLWPPGQTSEAGASGVSVHRKIHHHPEEDSDTDHPGTQ